MSDYVHNKAVRLPFPKEILDKFNTNDPWDCEEYLKELLGELYNRKWGFQGEYYIVDVHNKVYIKLYNKQVQITNHDFFYKKDVDGKFLKTLIKKVQAYVNTKIEVAEKAVVTNESDLLRYIYLKQ